MNEPRSSLLQRVPNELYFKILEVLVGEVDSYQASLGILNLALSEKENFRFINDWCERKVNADLVVLNSFAQSHRIPATIHSPIKPISI
jgi:hypothetical protein